MSLLSPEEMFGLTSDWVAPDPTTWPDWRGAARVAVDLETRDPDLRLLGPGVRRGAKVIGYAIGIDGGPRMYLPVGHEGGGNVDPEQARRYVREQAARYEGTVVGMNLGYDLDFLAEEGVTFPAVAGFFDVGVAEPLLDENASGYSLDEIAKRRLGVGKDEAKLREAALAHGVDPKSGMWRLHAKYVGPYGEGDVDRPLRIMDEQLKLIAAEDLGGILEIENALVPIFVEIKRQGIPVDIDRLAAAETRYLNCEMTAVAEIKRLTGVDLTNRVWEAEACAEVLRQRGIEPPLTAKGQPSVTKELLAACPDRAGGLLRDARKWNKMRTTFCAQIRDHVIVAPDGTARVHPNYNQIRTEQEGELKGAVTGRPSMDHPNLLFMPIRDDEVGGEFRSMFRADRDAQWAKVDYSQQEPRITLDLACRLKYPSAHELAARYWDDQNIDCHQAMADLTGQPRKIAKNIYLGMTYGMGGAKLCNHYLNLPTEWAVRFRDGVRFFPTEAEAREAARGTGAFVWEEAGAEGRAIFDAFHAAAPFLKDTKRYAETRAKERGFIRTLLGRRCRFPRKKNGSGYDWTHKALNRYVQGSAADQTKKAMVDVRRETGTVLYLQVYDELDFPAASMADAERVAAVMRETVKLLVPVKADPAMGPSWGEVA